MLVPEIFIEFGLAGVFLSALLGGTIIPLASELVVLAALAAGFPWFTVLIFAGIGNSIAVGLNYLIGFYAFHWLEKHRNIPESALNRMRRYGWPALAFSWVPVIGDPLTVAAGVLKLPWLMFFVITIPMRWLRYLVIAIPWVNAWISN